RWAPGRRSIHRFAGGQGESGSAGPAAGIRWRATETSGFGPLCRPRVQLDYAAPDGNGGEPARRPGGRTPLRQRDGECTIAGPDVCRDDRQGGWCSLLVVGGDGPGAQGTVAGTGFGYGGGQRVGAGFSFANRMVSAGRAWLLWHGRIWWVE